MSMGTGQRVCLLAVMVCGLAVVAGLVAPFWIRMVLKLDALVARGSYTVDMGVFYSCTSASGTLGTYSETSTKCEFIGVDEKEGFDAFQVGRLLSFLSLVLLVLIGPITCCAYCCCGDRAASALGCGAVLAGLLGIGGGAIFIYKTRDGVKSVGSLMSLLKAFAGEGELLATGSSYNWACYLYMAACILLVLLGFALVAMPRTKVPTVLQVTMPMSSPTQDGGPAYNRL